MKWVWVGIGVFAIIVIGLLIYFINKDKVDLAEDIKDMEPGGIKNPGRVTFVPPKNGEDCPFTLRIPVPGKVWVCRDNEWVLEYPQVGEL